MKLVDFICFDAIIPQLESSQRDGAIAELVMALSSAGKTGKAKPGAIIKSVIERENEASTGLGKGVAVPHVKYAGVQEVVAAVGCSSEGIDFSSLDKKPAYLVILLLSPADDADKHLEAMENIFRNLQRDDFRRFLRQARNVKQIEDVISEADGMHSA